MERNIHERFAENCELFEPDFLYTTTYENSTMSDPKSSTWINTDYIHGGGEGGEEIKTNRLIYKSKFKGSQTFI